MANFWIRLASIIYATQIVFVGSTVMEITDNYPVPMRLIDTKMSGQPSFLDRHYAEDAYQTLFVWGDVLKGIEEMSHNVTAALLTLQLGTMNSTCSFDQLDVQVYQYSSRGLWAPYGVSNFSLHSCFDLTFSPLCFIDGLRRCSNFTRFCRHDNGEK